MADVIPNSSSARRGVTSYTLAAGGTTPRAAIQRSTASSGTLVGASRTTRIQHRALRANGHEAVVVDGLAELLQFLSVPEVGDAGRGELTNGQLGPKLAGNGLAGRKDIEATVDRQATSPAAGRPIAPGQEPFEAR